MAKLRDISFVMPVANEEQHLRIAVDSVLGQKTAGEFELVIALGPSRDRTAEIAAELASTYEQIKVVPSATGRTSDSLNLAIAASRFECVIRVDAHSELPDGYAQLALDLLNQTGAANVGGLMVARGNGDFQSAVAFAYNHRIGLGGGSYHVGGVAGPADSVYLGCFRKSVLTELGGFDRRWVRGQDWELNQRIRASGHLVWFDPRLAVGYFPRRSWSALVKQFFNTGIWRGSLTRQNPGDSRFRYWVPPLLVLATLFVIPLWLYLAAIAIIAFSESSLPMSSRRWLAVVLPTMHLSWGAGFWLGLIRGNPA